MLDCTPTVHLSRLAMRLGEPVHLYREITTIAPCIPNAPCMEYVCTNGALGADPVTGCREQPTFHPDDVLIWCDDGDDCTKNACKDGECEVIEEVLCPSSKKACRENKCFHGAGCVEVLAEVGCPCDDGATCTSQEVCNAVGVCVGVVDEEACVSTDPCVTSMCSVRRRWVRA